MILRPLLLAALVLYCASLIGCASMDIAERDCNVRPVRWAAIATEGEITLAWRVDPIQVERNCGHVYGCAMVRGRRVDVWLMDGRSPECTLMTLAHEIRHGMGPPGAIVKHD